MLNHNSRTHLVGRICLPSVLNPPPPSPPHGLFVSPPPDLSWGVLVCGAKNRNRAVHGDVVVVELLPRGEWRGRDSALAEGPGGGGTEEKRGEDADRKPMPTGEVAFAVGSAMSH